MRTSDTLLREVRRFAVANRADDDPDRALVERFARSRDEGAFAELVRRHGPMVLGVCRRVLRHSADADDAFQATFLILVRRARVIRDPDRLGAWLFGVAWRTANRLRTSRRPGSPLPEDVPAREPPPTDWPVELDAAIARLPEKYRTPIVLCHLQGLSAAEAARRLGCPPATLTTRLFRARNTLRRKLTALGLSVPAALVAESVLHVPSALAAAAHAMAAGRSISPAAARLADGAFRSLLMTKIRSAATAAAVCLAGVGVLGFRAGGQEPGAGPIPPPAPPAVAVPPPGVPDRPVPDHPELATVKTANFRVTAPSARIARLVADAAERARKDAATAWLGREQPARAQACRITVSIAHAGAGGATTFNFEDERVTAEMHVEGELDRLLADIVPHEVTHVVMADDFKKPLPRWADEGIAQLSESEEEQARYAGVFAQAANGGRLIQLKALLAARDYPTDMGGFFVESYSLAKVLVDRRDRQTLVSFVKTGMTDGWEAAAKAHYGLTLDELERVMLEKVKAAARGDGDARDAERARPGPVFATATADPAGRVTVYLPSQWYEPVTSYIKREERDKNGAPRNYYEPVTEYRLRSGVNKPRSYARGVVRAHRPNGQAVEEAALIDALKGKPVPVVLAMEADSLDKAFADLLKPDTLILVVPPEKDELRPPPTAPPVGR
jgi:RNA polymerase sigma factor (sigma-70 family)